MGQVAEIRASDERWVDAKEVARHLGFSPDHIVKMARRKQLPARNCGYGKRQYWRFRISEIDKRLAETA